MEKLTFTLVVSTRRLRPYFQAHTIHAFTSQPLRQVLQKPETSGRLIKRPIKLGEFDIHYKPRPATPLVIAEPTPPSTLVHLASEGNFNLNRPLWTLHVDGSSNSQGCGAGLVLTSPDKVVLEYAFCFNFNASNNVAEYDALLAGLQLARR